MTVRRGTWTCALGVRITPDLKGMTPSGMGRALQDDEPPALCPERPSCCRISTSSKQTERRSQRRQTTNIKPKTRKGENLYKFGSRQLQNTFCISFMAENFRNPNGHLPSPVTLFHQQKGNSVGNQEPPIYCMTSLAFAFKLPLCSRFAQQHSFLDK